MPIDNFNENSTSSTSIKASEEVIANTGIFDEHFDLDVAKCFAKDIITLLDRVYFRSEIIGFDEAPERNENETPLIYLSNHSGMAFPWDGIMLTDRLHKLYDYGKDATRAITSPAISFLLLMNPFLIENFWKIMSGVDATFLNFETMMHQKYNILSFPEGINGIGKGFNKKYQLQRMSSSFVHMAMKYDTDIIPISTINGEYINPYAYCSKFINKMINFFGIPFLPLGFMTPILIVFPFYFFVSLPARFRFIRGERIKISDLTDKKFDEMSRDDLREVADKVRELMQVDLTKAREKYGKNPYKWGELFKKILKEFKHFPYSVPLGWPLLFAEFERVRIKNKNTDINHDLKLGFLSTFRIMIQNPFVITYYIPIIGWVPLLFKGFTNVLRKMKAQKKAGKKKIKKIISNRS